MKSSAIRGLSVKTAFSPFYDTARRFLGISPATVDEYLAAGATAQLGERIVTLTKPGGQSHVAATRGWHRTKAAKWVNDFNRRAQEKV
jgi:hypothetical protein